MVPQNEHRERICSTVVCVFGVASVVDQRQHSDARTVICNGSRAPVAGKYKQLVGIRTACLTSIVLNVMTFREAISIQVQSMNDLTTRSNVAGKPHLIRQQRRAASGRKSGSLEINEWCQHQKMVIEMLKENVWQYHDASSRCCGRKRFFELAGRACSTFVGCGRSLLVLMQNE